MDIKRIGFLGFDGVQGLDIIGPLEAFATANEHLSSSKYETIVVAVDGPTFVSETGVTFSSHVSLEDAGELDTLVIPGGRTLRFGDTSSRISAWLTERSKSIARIASVCTGIYAFAPTGWLDGNRVATHWRFADDVARRYPNLRVDADALFIKNGRFYTAAGITAGIDLALALIEEDHGPCAALAVARELVVYMKRPGGQEQFSEPLRFQLQARDSFEELTSWMRDHLRQDLSVEQLAAKANLCPRHFSRRFKTAFGTTPALFVETMRLNESRNRLSDTHESVEGVGLSVGFNSARAFRRAFERRFGITPARYRECFAVHSNGNSRSKGE